MKLSVIDDGTLAKPQPRDVRLYLRIHGWTRTTPPYSTPDVWMLPISGSAYEVIAPSSRRAPDYPRRIRELLRTVSIAEDRSELEVFHDLLTLEFDIQEIHSEHGGPPGTAPLRDATTGFYAAQNMLASAASSFEEPHLVLPARRSARASDLMRRVLAGPVAEGSFVISIWVPVPPRLRPDEDGVLFEPEEFDPDEPYARSTTRFLNRALSATRAAALDTLGGEVGLDPFTRRESEGVSANLCESLVNLSGADEMTLNVHFSWALERPVREEASVIDFSAEMIPVLSEAAASLRAAIPEDDVTIRGNVVRLHREGSYNAGDVSISGVILGDVTEKLRRVTVSLAEEDYQQAISAHGNYTEVEISGSLTQRSNRSYLSNARNFTLLISTDE